MFANLLHLFTRRPAPSPDYDQAFVQNIRVRHHNEPRNRFVERLLIAGWALIIVKSALLWWACAVWPVPFHPMWVIGPTWAMGALCTLIYLFR